MSLFNFCPKLLFSNMLSEESVFALDLDSVPIVSLAGTAKNIHTMLCLP